MEAISSYRGNRPTNTPTQPQTQTGPITVHCAAELSAQCNNESYNRSKQCVCIFLLTTSQSDDGSPGRFVTERRAVSASLVAWAPTNSDAMFLLCTAQRIVYTTRAVMQWQQVT